MTTHHELIATKAESALHELLTGEGGNPFSLDCSRLYGLNIGLNTGALHELSTGGDVYDLLSNADKVWVSQYDAIGLVTTGWAAPLNADGEAEGAPSQHPKRRRVRLFIVANRESVASVLRFEDDPENTITDLGEATGSLNDAVREFLYR